MPCARRSALQYRRAYGSSNAIAFRGIGWGSETSHYNRAGYFRRGAGRCPPYEGSGLRHICTCDDERTIEPVRPAVQEHKHGVESRGVLNGEHPACFACSVECGQGSIGAHVERIGARNKGSGSKEERNSTESGEWVHG